MTSFGYNFAFFAARRHGHGAVPDRRATRQSYRYAILGRRELDTDARLHGDGAREEGAGPGRQARLRRVAGAAITTTCRCASAPPRRTAPRSTRVATQINFPRPLARPDGSPWSGPPCDACRQPPQRCRSRSAFDASRRRRSCVASSAITASSARTTAAFVAERSSPCCVTCACSRHSRRGRQPRRSLLAALACAGRTQRCASSIRCSQVRRTRVAGACARRRVRAAAPGRAAQPPRLGVGAPAGRHTRRPRPWRWRAGCCNPRRSTCG